jgi:hypothetical protein
MATISSDQLRSDLRQFIGTEAWHRHWTKRLLYTDGVEFFCEQARAFWLLDVISTEVVSLQDRSPFLFIEFDVAKDHGELRVTDGNDHLLWKKQVWTDCPVGIWKFYLSESICILPSEY